jgi:hypothetical protein
MLSTLVGVTALASIVACFLVFRSPYREIAAAAILALCGAFAFGYFFGLTAGVTL